MQTGIINIVYENPFDDKLKAEIDTNEEEIIQCSIHDFSGRQILTDNWSAAAGVSLMQKHIFSFDMKNIADGIYLVVMKNTQNVISKTFVKINK